MQTLSMITSLLAAALTAATLISTLASLLGRARLQKICDAYREELDTESRVSKEVVEALHLKYLAQLISCDTYPARWTLTFAHAAVLFGISTSAEFGRLVATQDALLRNEVGGLVLSPAFGLLMIPISVISMYGSVVLKRVDIRREIAAGATQTFPKTEADEGKAPNGEKFALWAVATAPNLAAFGISYMVALDGHSFSGPEWVTWTMSGTFVVVFCLGGGSAWYFIPRMIDRLEASAVQPIADLPTRPSEREDSDRELSQRIRESMKIKQAKKRAKDQVPTPTTNHSYSRILKRRS